MDGLQFGTLAAAPRLKVFFLSVAYRSIFILGENHTTRIDDAWKSMIHDQQIELCQDVEVLRSFLPSSPFNNDVPSIGLSVEHVPSFIRTGIMRSTQLMSSPSAGTRPEKSGVACPVKYRPRLASGPSSTSFHLAPRGPDFLRQHSNGAYPGTHGQRINLHYSPMGTFGSTAD